MFQGIIKRTSVKISVIVLIALMFCSAIIVSCSGNGAVEPVTTIILVRHAEADTVPADDPELSELGRNRAETLLHILRETDISAIYTSQRLRTKRTVEPIANLLGLEMTPIEMIRDETKPNNIALESIEETYNAIQKHRGGTVLIAGHSNTVPEILRRLGIEDPPQISSDDHGNLFIVTTGEKASMVRLRYGMND